METLQELSDYLDDVTEEIELDEVAIEIVELPDAVEAFAHEVLRAAVNLQLKDADHPEAAELFTALAKFRKETGT